MAFRLPRMQTNQQQKSWWEEADEWVKSPGASLSNAIDTNMTNLTESFNEIIGQPTRADIHRDQNTENANKRNEDDAKRAQMYNEAISGNISTVARQQIEALFAAGGSTSDIAKILAESKTAKGGVYFVSRENDLRRARMAQAPGRDQTVLSLGQGSVLGGGRGY